MCPWTAEREATSVEVGPGGLEAPDWEEPRMLTDVPGRGGLSGRIHRSTHVLTSAFASEMPLGDSPPAGGSNPADDRGPREQCLIGVRGPRCPQH